MTTYFSDFSPVSRIDSGLLYFLKSCKCGKHLLCSGSVEVNCYFIITSAFNDCSYRSFSEFDMSDTVSHSVRKLSAFWCPELLYRLWCGKCLRLKCFFRLHERGLLSSLFLLMVLSPEVPMGFLLRNGTSSYTVSPHVPYVFLHRSVSDLSLLL